MLINEIVEYCNAEYRNADTTHLCRDCNHPSECSGSCKNCLEQVHYPSRYPNGKKDYDCENMINFYVCDYTNKYASEMLYLLRKSDKLKEIYEYHILSIGCGAVPDLMAFEQYLLETNPYQQIHYLGIDVNPLWKPIHNKVKNYKSDVISYVEFEYDDAINYLSINTVPPTNVIILQYVISHFYNTDQIDQIKSFFEYLVQNVILKKKKGEPTIILINDVNSYNRGRDFFTDIIRVLEKYHFNGQYSQYYFDYRIQNNNQRYGEKHPQNDILFELSDFDLEIYDPWQKCSSAQMLIEIE